MRTVVFNRKGGVGKSTIVCNLAAVAAAAGRRTLVVDLDPQGNASHYLLGREAGDAAPAVDDFFEESLGFRLLRSAAASFVHPTPFENLFLLPAGSRLAELQGKLEGRFKIYKLRELVLSLVEGEGFDEVWLDTPPAVGFFTTSALIAAERCLIPFDCDEFSRRALYQLLGTVREVAEDHNADLTVGGIVVNQFQERARLPARLVEELRSEGLPVLEPFLTTSVIVRESHERHTPLVFLEPRHKLSGQLRELYRALAAGRVAVPAGA